MTINVISFQEAIKQSEGLKRFLLLGNGFSIAWNKNIFTYNSLFEQAKLSSFKETPELIKVFEILQTNDFESIIKALEAVTQILPIYLNDKKIANTIRQQALTLKKILIETIANNHPELPNKITPDQFYSCRNFLSYFISKDLKGAIYTLNYDLLLYWVLLHEEPFQNNAILLNQNDGFGRNEDTINTDYVIWQGEDPYAQMIHYLHGAIHLFDRGSDLRKITWLNNNKPLLQQIKEYIDTNWYPLFVAEGESQKKLAKIKHNPYLYHSYKSFSKIMRSPNNCLFIYGHSLAENDNHILLKIFKGAIPRLFISIFGDPTRADNKAIIQRTNYLRSLRSDERPLDIVFYQAESAKIWNAFV